MLTDALISIGGLVMDFFTAILPNSDGLPSGFGTALQNFFDLAYSFNGVLPVDTLLTILGLIISFEAGIMLYRLTRWILASLPLSSIKH